MGQRQFWLTPSVLTNQIVLYCIAYAAMLFGVKIHAMTVMSNHWHAVITDVKGRYPQFLHRAHLLISKCINPLYGRWENLWSDAEPSVVELCDEGAVIDKVLYTLVNPTKDGLVACSDDWPGLRTTPEDWTAAPYEVERPRVYFSEQGAMPARLSLAIERPPVSSQLTDAELANEMRAQLRGREADIQAAFAASGRTFLGVEAILATPPSSSPATRAPRRGLIPRFAAKSRAVLVRAILARKEWLASYATSLSALRSGERDVSFPPGTWALGAFVDVRPAPT